MTVQSLRLEVVSQRVRELRERERQAESPWRRRGYALLRWASMLNHQFIADDVRIRAESLTFLAVLSLLPLIAGAFFVFTLFTQFGLVQEALQSGLANFLGTIPDEHRAFVLDYILRFKDAYLASIGQKSGSFGIFALFILVWVGLQFFSNIERTLNHIWSADRQRAFVEQLRNFLVISVAAPIVIIAGLSLPLVLQNIPGTRFLLERVPLLGTLLKDVIPSTLVFLTFLALYKYVPVRRVWWRSAAAGALFTTILIQATNIGMRVYFKFGTNTAYGKLAVVPLVAFWIYITWLVVILGAELSFLMQNESEILAASPHDPTFREGEAMLLALRELHVAFRDARNPVSFERLHVLTGLKTSRLRYLLNYLIKKELALECSKDGVRLEGHYVLARDLAEVPVSELLAEFFASSWKLPESGPESAVVGPWKDGLRRWTESFAELRIPALNSPG